MKQSLVIIFTLLCLCTKAQRQMGISLPGDSAQITLATKLGVPFGTISKLEVEVFDGYDLHMKAYQSDYLLKINSVNDKPVNDTLLLRFTDETGTLANDIFSLSKLVYKKDRSSLSDAQIKRMSGKYIGKKYTLMAYETGRFTGIPQNYFDYRPAIASLGFHFEHSLIIVSNLTK